VRIRQPDRDHDEVLAHLDTAYRLARWHAPGESDAAAIVEEAYRRVLCTLGTPSTGTLRARFLSLVTAVCREMRGRPEIRLSWAAHTRPDRQRSPGAVSGGAPFVESAIRRLPEPLREVLVLSDVEGLTSREVSDVLRLSPEAAASQLSRARRALACELSRLSTADAPHPIGSEAW
jgi:RNA polymerase sigma-70 factor (ECF subfamily)